MCSSKDDSIMSLMSFTSVTSESSSRLLSQFSALMPASRLLHDSPFLSEWRRKDESIRLNEWRYFSSRVST